MIAFMLFRGGARTLAACLAATVLSLGCQANAQPAGPAAQAKTTTQAVSARHVQGPTPNHNQHKHRSAFRHRKVLMHRSKPKAQSTSPQGIGEANAAARIQPERTSWLNAIQQYAWGEGALYQVYTAPGQVTDIVLQDGEELSGSGPVAAGDTARWIIGDTQSGSGATKRVHILVKPTRGDIATNLVINTDRRTYHLELRATPATYMAAVTWTYPADALIALQKAKVEEQKAAPVAAGIDVTALNFHYRIDGDKPVWRPTRAFDDGRQVFIEFPEGIATGEMPPLFVVGADGAAQLVNYPLLFIRRDVGVGGSSVSDCLEVGN